MFNETIDTMIDHSDKKLDYALRAIQHPQLRETDEFLQWIGIPENKELFLELMACKEAVIRENLQRKRKYRKKMRILAIASSVAAVLILAFLIPSLLPSTSLPAEQPIPRKHYHRHHYRSGRSPASDQIPGDRNGHR